MQEDKFKNKDGAQLRQQLSSIKIEDRGVQFTLTPEYVRENMYCAVINTEKNEKLLERCPHKPFVDLSVVAKCDLGSGRSLFVTEEFVQLLRMSGEEIVEHVKLNSEKAGYTCQNLGDVIESVLADTFMSKDEIREIQEIRQVSDDEYPMYVLTTPREVDGAAVMVSKKYLQEVHNKFGEDFYVLPSSRHEVMAVPVSRAPELPDLKELVRTVNTMEVQERDRLSNEVYYYDGKKLQLADERVATQENTMTETLSQEKSHCIRH